MKSVNKITLIGNLGKDVEMNAAGTAARATMATSHSVKNRDTGIYEEHTTWHSLVFFGKTAEIAAKYLHKGSSAYVEGRIEHSRYEKDGVTKYFTSIIVNNLVLLGSSAGTVGSNANFKAPAQANQQSSQQKQHAWQSATLPADTDMRDIPF